MGVVDRLLKKLFNEDSIEENRIKNILNKLRGCEDEEEIARGEPC